MLVAPEYPRTNGASRKGYGAITREDGKFSWNSIAPGSYDLVVETRGYMVSSTPGELKIDPGSATHDLSVKLAPEATLTGRVLDSHGDSVEGANVSLVVGGNDFKTGATDDRGEFRFTGLPARKYLLRAAPPQVLGPAEIRTDGTKEECHAPTWFPNAIAKAEASPVEVTAGAALTGIEIHLVRIPIVRVSGSVTGAASKDLRIAGAEVRDGKFAIWRLPPGKHQLSAYWLAPDGGQLRSYPLSVDVAQSNIDNLTVEVVPEFELAGQVMWDGTPPPADRLKEAQITIQWQYMGKIAADGGFRIPHVTVGKQRVGTAGMPDNVFVKSIHLGDDEMPGRDLDLRSDPKGTRVTVVLSAAAAEVSGIVRKGDAPAPKVYVCAEPDGEPGGCERTAHTGADGAFSFRGLAPGRYKLYVMGDFGDPPDPSLVEVLELHEGEKTTRDLTVH
jgi:protocatechuate 3,4-dioxygenase beta subunit